MNTTIDRKRIFIFMGITYGITITLALVIFFNGGLYSDYPRMTLLGNILLAVTMFVPALANIATRLITREGWSNTFLRPNLFRGWPFYLAAWFLPLIAIILGGAIYFLLFPGRFDLSMTYARQTGQIPADWIADPWAVVISRAVLRGFRNVLIYFFLFLGEEFGWRAYLLPKLLPLGTRKAILLLGVIWGMFHWPAIFMGFQYGLNYWGAPVVGPLLFVLIIMSPNALFAWVTLRTGSVWPACIAHGVHNATSMLVIYFLRGEPDSLIGPNAEGIVGCLGYALLALLIFLIPRILAQPAPAPAGVVLSEYPGAIEKAADQAMPGTVS
jgi:membrane protease YdiL (CAAX protease family)